MNLSPGSELKLKSCHEKLQTLVHLIAAVMPVIVLEGERGEVEQHIAFTTGRSKLDYPHSKHNSKPSMAVDLAPAPYDPKDLRRLLCFCGYVLGVASAMGIRIRSGASWSHLPNPVDPLKYFSDLFHFELET